MKRVVVVGGGITGLAATRALGLAAERRGQRLGITLLEKGPRVGGNLRTEHVDGFLIDSGPDSWVVSKPQASALVKALGLGHELMPTIEATRRVYIAWGGALHPLPEGLVLGVPTRITPMIKTPLFSWAGKARMALEPFVTPKAWEGDEDESISSFITRRLGEECCERLAAPLLGGIFAGDATRISVRATFPQFVDAERRHGSIILAMRHERAARAAATGQTDGGKAPSAFVTLRSGMARLAEAVAEAARRHARLETGRGVRRIAKTPAGSTAYVVETDDGEALPADAVILAGPAHVSAKLLAPLDGVASRALAGTPFVSTATVFYAFPREAIAHPLDAVGFLVPKPLGRRILAVTWVTSKWENRAPEGHVLMRVFFGGDAGEAILEREDAELARAGLDELRDLMGLDATPLFSRVYRFDKASPQPRVGHLGRMATLKRRLTSELPGLHVVGGGVYGIGVPECVRQGEEAAAAIAELLTIHDDELRSSDVLRAPGP